VLGRLRGLARNLAIYGIGDVAASIVSFLLLPLYVHYLTPTDYGAIGLLLSGEVIAKIVFRMGVDGAFMRLFYDCRTDADRQRLASTLFWFLAATNGVIAAVLIAAAQAITAALFKAPGYELPFQMVVINTFVIGFYFIPFHVMRMNEQSTEFAVLTGVRTAATLVARLVLIVGFGQGVFGFVVADLIVTAIFTLILAPRFAPFIRLMFSWDLLREALRFGLPRLPHGLAQQAMAVLDRYLLGLFAGLREVGLYSIGASFGLAIKLFLSAFEYAWAPFYYATMKERDAKDTFRLVTTYGVGVLVLLEAGLAATAHDVVRLMTTPEFVDAANVIPWIGLGVAFQGFYLLTSIGLNITKATRYYPVATGIAAVASLVGNLLLIPRYGAMGAAWINACSYAVLAGTAYVLSQRVYPVRHEYGRLARLIAAGVGAWLAARAWPATASPFAGFLLRGLTVLVAYPILLAMLGFYQRREIDVLARLVRARRSAPEADAVPIAPGDEPVELAGAILEVPLMHDELPPRR
jgi:O-antigen/teichoic acid export membrane protein